MYTRSSIRSFRTFIVACALALATAVVPTASAQSGSADATARAIAKIRNQRLLLLAAAEFDPVAEKPALPAALTWGASDVAELDYFLLQLVGKPMASDHQELAARGAEELDYIPNNAFIIRARTRSLPKLKSWERTRALVPFQPAYRVDTDLLASAAKQGERRLDLAIFLFHGADTAAATLELRELGVDLLDVDAGRRERLNVEAPASALVAMAHVRDVQWIEPQAIPTPRNDTTTWVIQSNVQDQTPVWDQGLLGDNVIIGHIDDPIDINSCYFVDPNVPAPGPTHRKIVAHHGSYGNPDAHGTHTAGTAAGDQEPINGVTDHDGIGYHARIAHTNLGLISSTNLDTKLSELIGDGARIFTNSWGDDTTTKYNGWCFDIDYISFNNWDVLIMFAVTNLSTLKNPENAKNLIAVGATDQAPNQMNWCTGGAGPTADGRRKPELYAPGCSIVSAKANASCDTTTMSGTSMASPAIAGAASLAKQYFESGVYPSGAANPADAFTPSGALLKAVLLDSAVDLTGVSGYPSDTEGWGRLLLDDGLFFSGDARRLWVADVLTGHGFASSGETQTHFIHVDSNALSLEMCLVFMDKQGAVNSKNPVVNDLDLEVVAPDGTLYRGNYFSNGVSAANGSPDPLNNVERVKLAAPLAGWYTVTIRATTIASLMAQAYALVATGDLDPPSKGGFVTYGSGLAGTGGFIPSLAGSGSPTIDDDVTLTVSNGLGGAPGDLLIGFARASIPFAGGTLLVQPPWIVIPMALGGTPGVGGAGTFAITDTIPADPTLVGVLVDFQAVIVDHGAVKKFALTNGLEMTIGS